MWNTGKSVRGNKMVAYANCYYEDDSRQKEGGKLSCMKAAIIGFLVTIEIMVAGAMIFNIDFHGADSIALIFAFMVLYFGVVAVLTDK